MSVCLTNFLSLAFIIVFNLTLTSKSLCVSKSLIEKNVDVEPKICGLNSVSLHMLEFCTLRDNKISHVVFIC